MGPVTVNEKKIRVTFGYRNGNKKGLEALANVKRKSAIVTTCEISIREDVNKYKVLAFEQTRRCVGSKSRHVDTDPFNKIDGIAISFYRAVESIGKDLREKFKDISYNEISREDATQLEEIKNIRAALWEMARKTYDTSSKNITIRSFKKRSRFFSVIKSCKKEN